MSESITLERAITEGKEKTAREIRGEFTQEQKRVFDTILSNEGWDLKFFKTQSNFEREHPGDKSVKIMLIDMKYRRPEMEEFQSIASELIELLKV